MKYLLIILFPFFFKAQLDKIPSEVKHFYGAIIINEGTYQIQSFAYPKWTPTKKVLIANGITLTAIFGKEIYDKHKKNPTGFSWDDIFIGCWSIPVYDIVRICINDVKKRREYSFENKNLLVN